MSSVVKSPLSSIILSSFLIGCSGGQSNNPSNNIPTDAKAAKIVAYTKNNKLYEFDMYVGSSNTQALIVHYTSNSLPADAVAHQYTSLQDFINDRHNLDPRFKRLPNSITTSNNNIGWLGVGYIPSIQAIFAGSNGCYTSNPSVNGASKASSYLVVTNSSSNAQSMKSNSTNISAGFAGFKVSNKDSFSNNYSSSTSSGQYTLGGAVATIVSTGVPSTNNISQNGLNLLNNNSVQFLNNCGTAALEAYIGGILITQNLNVQSSSQSTSHSFSDAVSTGYDSDSVSQAFSSSKSNSSSFNSVSITYNINGDVDFPPSVSSSAAGATDYATYIANAIVQNSANYVQCTGNPVNLNACSTYNSNLSNSITAGFVYAQSAIAAGNGATTLYPFPDGINLANPDNTSTGNFTNPVISGNTQNPYISFVSANNGSTTISDPFTSQAGFLQNAILSAYQINALAGKAQDMANLPGVNTSNEITMLNNLANYYYNDSNNIINVASNCYNAIMNTNTSNPAECNQGISIANGALNFQLSTIPNNIYQLYGNNSNQPPSGSLLELLLNNSVALQYQINYSEMATGTWKGNDMIRTANQIGFGLAYFNATNYSPEFLGTGNIAYQPNPTSGYIMPNIITPVLGNLPINKFSNPAFGEANGTQWWQPYSDNGPIKEMLNYPTSPLYFVFIGGNFIPFGQTQSTSLYLATGLNKIIGNNLTTFDSFNSTNTATSGHQVILSNQTVYLVPSINQLANGSTLPSFNYNFTGAALANNSNPPSSTDPEECFAGVFLPTLNSDNTNLKFGYGLPNNQYSYLCNGVPTPEAPTWFSLNNGNAQIAYPVKNIEQTNSLSFSPVTNFFGLSN